MSRLLVKIFNHHTIEKNVYPAFLNESDAILFLSLSKIKDEEKISLKHFLMEQVSHIKQVTFRQISLEKFSEELDPVLTNYKEVVLDVFGNDSLLAIKLYQYGMERKLSIHATDIEGEKQYAWDSGKLVESNLNIPSLSIQQLIELRGGKLIKSKQHRYSQKQIAAIKKLANYAISNPEQWFHVTQFFALAKTGDFHAETGKILMNNGKRYPYPAALISLLTEAGMLHIDEDKTDKVIYTFPSSEAQLTCRTKGHILELYLYLLAKESNFFDECMIGAEIDWNGIFPEVDNVQNEIDVVLRKGRSIIFISCKMTDLSVEAINELEVYANHFAGESCLKLIVCSGKINPVYANRCHEYGVLVIKNNQISNLIPMLEKRLKRK